MKSSLHSLLICASALATCALLGGCQTKPAASGSMPEMSATPAAPAAPTPPAAPISTAPAGKVALKVVKVDSEETAGEDGKGANAVDGDPNTIWHTQWQDASPECPHEIVIELTPSATIKGFTYLPRPDDGENGTIKDYEFYVSSDGQDFGQPVAKGELENSKSLKTVTFDAKACRFVKLKAVSEVNGAAWTSAAEIGVVQ